MERKRNIKAILDLFTFIYVSECVLLALYVHHMCFSYPQKLEDSVQLL